MHYRNCLNFIQLVNTRLPRHPTNDAFDIGTSIILNKFICNCNDRSWLVYLYQIVQNIESITNLKMYFGYKTVVQSFHIRFLCDKLYTYLLYSYDCVPLLLMWRHLLRNVMFPEHNTFSAALYRSVSYELSRNLHHYQVSPRKSCR